MGLTKYQEIYTFMMEQAATNKDFMTLYYLGLAGAALIFLCKLIASLVFDKVYYKHVISKVKQIEAEATDKEEVQLAIRKYGGLNIFSFIIAIMLLQYVPSIIASLIL